MRIRRSLALLATGALFAAACGDDDDDRADGAAGGEPIKVMALGTTESPALAFPEGAAAILAHAAAVNEAGGIAGRPVEVEVCNDAFDPNEAGACARRAIDGGFVAVLGWVSVHGDVITSTLEAGGVPYLGHNPVAPGDTTSEISFPIAGGVPTAFAGLGRAMAEDGCESIASVGADDASAKVAEGFFTAGVEAGGGEVEVLRAPRGSDYAAAAAGTAGADCVGLLMPERDAAVVLPAVLQANPDARIGALAATISILLPQFGEQLEGQIIASDYRPVGDDAEVVQQFRAEMEAAGHGDDLNGVALSAWTGAKVLFDVLDGLDGDITAATVLEALDGLSEVDTGTTGPIDFTAEGPTEALARLFNTSVIELTVEDGEIVPVDGAEFRSVAEVLAA